MSAKISADCFIFDFQAEILPKVVDNSYDFGHTDKELFGGEIRIGCSVNIVLSPLFELISGIAYNVYWRPLDPLLADNLFSEFIRPKSHYETHTRPMRKPLNQK